jgi:large subunit ribosomal protein L18
MRFEGRERRHLTIKKRIYGTKQRPRFCVYRANKHIYGILIDDSERRVLTSVSTLSKEIKARKDGAKGKVEIAKAVGKLLAEKAKALGIERVVFDRAGYKYHGRVKALTVGAREGGLIF